MSSYSVLVFAAAAMLVSLALPVRAQTSQPGPQRLKLWENTPGVVAGRDTDVDPTEPTVDIYLPDESQASGSGVVVLPGGGYTHLSTAHEGSEIAHMLLSHHIAAFVVRYRHAPRYQYPVPILDGKRAMRLVRSKAAEFKVDPHRIGVIGFSAGGHLAASLATGFDAGDATASDPVERVSCRPDFVALLYPVITLTEAPYVHKGSRDALVGTRQELWAQLSPEQHVTHETPPIFLAHAGGDTAVPAENSILFFEACRKNHVPAELHIFQTGGHGFALAATDPALRVWPDLMMDWMLKNKWITTVK